MTISSEGKLAELIFKSTTLRLLLLLLLALEAVLPLVSTIGVALATSSNSLILLKLFVFHHSVVVIVSLLWQKRRLNWWNFLIVASENLSSTITELSSSWRHCHRILLHLHLLLRVWWLGMRLREFASLLCLTLRLLSLQFWVCHRLGNLLLWLQLLLHLHRLLLHLLFH